MKAAGTAPRRAPGGPRVLDLPRGVTLVEVVIALLLLAVGALALAGGIASSERARRRALAEGLAVAAAEGWLEVWRATPWDSVAATGEGLVAWGEWEGRLEWTVSPLGPCLAEASVAAFVLERRVALVTRRFREGATGCGG